MTEQTGPSWRSLLARASAELASPLEARRIAEEVSGGDGPALFVALDEPAGAAAAARLADLVGRRRAGEPLQHVLGHWSFRTVELAVDGRALVPRPETEVVAGHALAELGRRRAERSGAGEGPGAPTLLAVDLGTGSGAIACALVSEADDVRVVAVDRSPGALALAASNRAALAPEAAGRLELVEADWYAGVAVGLRGMVDCVVANPPYLAAREWAELDPVVRDHDPYAALVAGPTGLEAVEAVVLGAPGVLAPGGALVVEIAPRQATGALDLARAAGASRAEVARDLAGRDRVLVARWDGSGRVPGRSEEPRC